MMVAMTNYAGSLRQVKVGFSWTAFFFGGFPFFFRGMATHGVIWIVLAVITFGISNLILMFIINKQIAHHYLENGYRPSGEGWDVAGEKWGIKGPGAA